MLYFAKNKNNGYTLVEMIIYAALLSVISLLAVSTIVSFSKSYRTLVVLRAVDHSAIGAMERMTRDIRGATSLDLSRSVFGAGSGVLTIVTIYNSIETTTKFYLDNGAVKIDVNGDYFGPLTLSNVSVTSLTFTKLDSGIGNAVKIDMTVSATVGTASKTKTYHSTVILRGQ
ncbi:MAG: prepilin-type N-terminal cleavage/methylation domain-containing protein [Candidatus Zambryskibacteria bacterium]|nr:prepilin-type N-terminal cleavage/methylation domain-containing protein [Candidatus Zambryskibacteria bacterium]